jgi:hypothetical protein
MESASRRLGVRVLLLRLFRLLLTLLGDLSEPASLAALPQNPPESLLPAPWLHLRAMRSESVCWDSRELLLVRVCLEDVRAGRGREWFFGPD